MRHLQFEWLKLWRNRSIALVIVVAIITALGNILINQSSIQRSGLDQNDIQAYANLSSSVYPKENGVITVPETLTEGQILVEAYMRVGTEDMEAIFAKPSLGLFSTIAYAWKLDQTPVTEQEQKDLVFAIVYADYVENISSLDEPYQSDKSSSLSLLKNGNAILFGIVPLMCFLILGIRLYGEDYDKGSIVYNNLLPHQPWQTLLARMTEMLSLVVIYLVAIFAFTSLFKAMMGNAFGDWQLPNRWVSPMGATAYLTEAAVIVRIMILFIAKAMVVISFGLLLVQLFKTFNLSWLIGAFVVLFFSFMTNYIPAAQKTWNLFSFNYLEQVRGERTLDLEAVTNRVLGARLIEAGDYWLWLSIWLLLTLVYLGLAYLISKLKAPLWKIYRQEKSSKYLAHPKLFGLFFESLKLNQILSWKYVNLLIILITIPLMAILHLQDVEKAHYELDDNKLAAAQQEIAEFEVTLQDISLELEAGDLNSREQDLMLSKIFAVSESKARSEEKLKNMQSRLQSFEAQDSKKYSQSFMSDINLWYGKEEHAYSNIHADRYLHRSLPSNFGYEVSLDRLKEISQRDLKPKVNSHIQVTIFDELKNTADQVAMDVRWQLADHSFLQATYRLIKDYRMDWIILILVISLCGAGYTLDLDNNSGLYWLYTLPRKRTKMYLDKVNASYLRALAILLGILVIVFVYGILTDGVGEYNFPVLKYLGLPADPQQGADFGEYFGWMNLGNVILYAVLLIALNLFLYLRVSTLISMFVKQYALVIVGTFAVIFGGYLLVLFVNNQFNWLLPFHYLDTIAIVTGKSAVLTGQSQLNYSGPLVLLAWSLLVDVACRWRAKPMKVISG